MDGEDGWWTTSGNIGLPPLARVMGVGRQQQPTFQAQSLSSSQTRSRDAKPTQHIEITHPQSSIQNWRSTRWRPVTNTIQHIHCRHTTTNSTSSGHGLRRRHRHHIYSHKHEYSKDIHTVFTWTKHNNLTPNIFFNALCSLQTLRNIQAIWTSK